MNFSFIGCLWLYNIPSFAGFRIIFLNVCRCLGNKKEKSLLAEYRFLWKISQTNARNVKYPQSYLTICKAHISSCLLADAPTEAPRDTFKEKGWRGSLTHCTALRINLIFACCVFRYHFIYLIKIDTCHICT